MLLEAVASQEVDARGRVEVVLVLHRLTGFGFEVELAGEADGLRMIHGHVHEGGEVVDLPLHVGVPETLVAFATAPEHIARAAEAMGDLERLLHLGRGVGERLRIRARGRAVDVPGIRKKVGRAPEQPDAAPLLVREEGIGDRIEILVALGERRALGRHIAIVKAIQLDTQLFEELECHVHATQRHVERVAAGLPGADHGAGTERIGARAAEGMPVGDGKAEMLSHGLAFHDRVGVVVAEGQHG